MPSALPLVFESEDATLEGATTNVSTGSGHSGGFADFNGSEGSALWTVTAPQAGTYTVAVKYAAEVARNMDLTVNCDDAATPVQFGTTGSWDEAWTSDITFDVELQAGDNHITLATNGGSGPNIDSLRLLLPACDISGETLCEAEPPAAYLQGAASVVATGSGWTGEGFADMNGMEGGVAWLLDLPAAGSYDLTWRYAQAEVRDMALVINGTQVNGSLAFAATGDWDTAWATDVTITRALDVGLNAVVLMTNGGSGANFDSLTVAPASSGDAGAPPMDAGAPPMDAGAPPTDASIPAADAGDGG